MLSILALATITSCATIINDPAPPTNVRNSPNGSVLKTLGNGTRLNVVEDRNGWLRISTPLAGWVHASVTAVHCGEQDPANFRQTVHAIDDLGARALDDGRAADLLVRYAMTADGGPGEAAVGGVGDLMRANPALAIATLDQIPDSKRAELLRSAVGLSRDSAATTKAFELGVEAHPSAATSVTWRRLNPTLGQHAAGSGMPANVASLIKAEERLNDTCRGGSGDLPATMQACNRRDKAVSQLQTFGWCYGKPNQIDADRTWQKCAR